MFLSSLGFIRFVARAAWLASGCPKSQPIDATAAAARSRRCNVASVPAKAAALTITCWRCRGRRSFVARGSFRLDPQCGDGQRFGFIVHGQAAVRKRLSRVGDVCFSWRRRRSQKCCDHAEPEAHRARVAKAWNVQRSVFEQHCAGRDGVCGTGHSEPYRQPSAPVVTSLAERQSSALLEANPSDGSQHHGAVPGASPRDSIRLQRSVADAVLELCAMPVERPSWLAPLRAP